MPSDTRDRLVGAAAELFMRQGLTATGVKQILGAADAQFSSLYHYFPGGKEELAGVAIVSSGRHYQALAEAAWDGATDLAGSVAAVFDGAAEVLVATDYGDACPIATVALEVASTNEQLRLATAEVFGSWVAALAERLGAAGVATGEAAGLARAVIALLEGAFVLARSAKSVEAMRDARDAAVALASLALR